MEQESQGMEPTEPKRTRESEIKANIEFWKDLGVEVDPEDVKEKIEELTEVEGKDWYIYVPHKMDLPNLLIKMTDMFPSYSPKDYEGLITYSTDVYGKPKPIYVFPSLFSPRNASKNSYAIAATYQQEPDENSIGAKDPFEWEKSEEDYMTLLERTIAEMRWFQENKTHLDNKFRTICPGVHKVISSGGYYSRGGPLDLHTPQSIIFDPEYAKDIVGMYYDSSQPKVMPRSATYHNGQVTEHYASNDRLTYPSGVRYFHYEKKFDANKIDKNKSKMGVRRVITKNSKVSE
ncbi:MAG: hypothetical protein PHW50_02225 [Patescibacteria group bacterium]|nr:hypothetical protein [Patescibacteria group bacterium]